VTLSNPKLESSGEKRIHLHVDCQRSLTALWYRFASADGTFPCARDWDSPRQVDRVRFPPRDQRIVGGVIRRGRPRGGIARPRSFRRLSPRSVPRQFHIDAAERKTPVFILSLWQLTQYRFSVACCGSTPEGKKADCCGLPAPREAIPRPARAPDRQTTEPCTYQIETSVLSRKGAWCFRAPRYPFLRRQGLRCLTW
jgi:hypothetical protein